MSRRHRSVSLSPSRASFLLLCALLVVLWVAGGGSRADVMGQVIVRAAAWLALMGGILFGFRPAINQFRPVWVLLLLAVFLCLLQLVPLPPGVWQALPGRSLFAEAAAATGQEQPWRPLAIVPGAAVNALSSLVVPLAVLLLASGLDEDDRDRLPGLFVALVAGGACVGVLQFSGLGYRNALINETPGAVGGVFANRNHFALYLALGCLVAPVWAFQSRRKATRPGGRWRPSVALGLILVFLLIILATGSRAGMLVGALALVGAAILARRGVERMLGGRSRRLLLAFGAAASVLVIGLVLISVVVGRAVSVNRIFAVDPGQDMRARGLSTVWSMLWRYFPAGSGLGSFDEMFRLQEPFSLLKLTYFNHAHNDFLEIVLNAGLPGLLLLLGALGWWLAASLRAWPAVRLSRDTTPALGSAMLLLIGIASLFDYPARTPIIMANIILAALWLARAPIRAKTSALPGTYQHL